MKNKYFVIVFIILGISHKSFAYSSDPKQFIQEIVDEAKKVLVDSNTKEFKTKKLSEMALKTVDIKGVAYYSLGNYKKKLSDEQMEEYLKLFEKYFKVSKNKVFKGPSIFKLTKCKLLLRCSCCNGNPIFYKIL